jgi:two-component system sensor histidine kinase TctE
MANGAHVMIEVGETRHKRDSLTNQILVGLAVLVLAMATMMIVSVWRGTARALAPLAGLEAEAASRSMENLAPLSPQGAPREVRGLIVAINRLMARLGESVMPASLYRECRTPVAYALGRIAPASATCAEGGG